MIDSIMIVIGCVAVIYMAARIERRLGRYEELARIARDARKGEQE